MITDSIVIILIILSGFFFLVGTLGLIRLPDVFSRMHATTKSDTLGAGLAIVALMVHRGLDPVSVKLFIILIFVLLTNPTGAHIIAKSAYYKDQTREEEANDANS
ncbi:multisubunit sodium/proton antiporter, MrpG subunit [Pelagirhabdus alkalitolerans]|uniref:Multisubunit sodium/proton antiporter, MrpG subunit n=1 Tax=Pelagirhabdus alkalitolerans TaxID=1612202 RepID=A0A1G6H7Z7_9BACI|nr:monovalent cation/H(+) antiporter subunit G [Pelagirhabdus alkalitolerans]SDB90399.1 multisubunit sodium/proton antiporter, MrpG subunit [Pelagirhabdus alkalitolerans]